MGEADYMVIGQQRAAAQDAALIDLGGGGLGVRRRNLGLEGDGDGANLAEDELGGVAVVPAEIDPVVGEVRIASAGGIGSAFWVAMMQRRRPASWTSKQHTGARRPVGAGVRTIR